MSNFMEIFVFMEEKIVIVISGITSFRQKKEQLGTTSHK